MAAEENIPPLLEIEPILSIQSFLRLIYSAARPYLVSNASSQMTSSVY
jgi:hypothetical protein